MAGRDFRFLETIQVYVDVSIPLTVFVCMQFSLKCSLTYILSLHLFVSWKRAPRREKEPDKMQQVQFLNPRNHTQFFIKSQMFLLPPPPQNNLSKHKPLNLCPLNEFQDIFW